MLLRHRYHVNDPINFKIGRIVHIVAVALIVAREMVCGYSMIAILTIFLSLLGCNFASPFVGECIARGESV